MLLEGKSGHPASTCAFSSIYETDAPSDTVAINPIAALEHEGVIAVADGRRFHVRQGKLNATGSDDAIWRIETAAGSDWLATVAAHTWGTFRDIGKLPARR